MKNFATVFSVLLLLPVFLFSTDVPAGDVSGLWNLAGSPYNVMGEIVIQAEAELEIEAGVEVIFNDYYALTVHGRILAVGTETDSISWTPANTTAGWHGVRFMDTNLNSLEGSELNYCRFTGSFAITPGEGQNGGAIYCTNSSQLVISNSFFSENYAGWDGGAICLKNGSDVEINNTLFLSNNCYFYGAGVVAYASSPILSYCDFKQNNATTFAGGFSSWNNATPELYNCNFIGNTAGACAGIYGVSSVIKMANIMFVGNTNDFGSGAACGLTSCTTEATNITAVDNISPLSGGAFWVNGGTLELHNSILWNNLPGNIYENNGTCNAYNSCISDGFTGTNIITDDPAFVDLDTYNLQLSEDSQCIDSGDISMLTLTLPELDLLGNLRLQDGDLDGTITVDMGAYEFTPIVATTGFIAGTVTNADAAVLENATITAGTYSTTTDAAGEYLLEVVAGIHTISCTIDGYVEMLAYSEIVLINETTIVDFVMQPEMGIITGSVTNTYGEILVGAAIEAGSYSTLTDESGNYQIELSAGTYTVTCELLGYDSQTISEQEVIAGETLTLDFILVFATDANEDVVNVLNLLSNYPNPFNPETTISFNIPAGESAELIIFNAKGEVINIYKNLTSNQKNLVWNGVDSSGKKVSSGIYLYQLRGRDKIQTKKMMLLK